MTYNSPIDLASALEIAGHGGVKIVAGGTDVYPSQQQGARPTHYLDVTRIKGFSNIVADAKGIRIGAATTWTQIAKSNLPPAFDVLKQAAVEVGGLQIQNAGTIAGNICNASPAADGVPPLLALDAGVELVSAARGKRLVPLGAFIKGVRKTDLRDDELVSAILIAPPPVGATSAFEKLGARRYLVISISMVAVVLTCRADGIIEDARIAVGACSPVATRLPALEQDLIGKRAEDVTIAEHYFAPLSPITDVRGSDAYRIDVVAAQCRRAIQRACR